MIRFVFYTVLIASLLSCSTSHQRKHYKAKESLTAKNPPPSTHSNICKIYKYDSTWKKAAKKSAKRWGTPEHILMAFVHQESRFVRHARPKYRGASNSKAYGYAQAQSFTWKEYQQSIKNSRAKRTSIYDALDFIGWYNNNTNKRNRVSKKNSQHLYLAYHEGNGGYSRKTYLKKPWLLKVSKKVEKQAATYRAQLRKCR